MAAGYSPCAGAGAFEFFGGYSLVHASIETAVPFASPSHVDTNGFNVAAVAYFNHWIGVVGDFSASFGTEAVTFTDPFSGQRVTGDIEAHVFPLQFGPQVRFPGNRITPFARATFGFTRIRTIAPDFRDIDVDPAFVLGGGVDVRASRHVSVRLGQADYIRSHLSPKLGKTTGGSPRDWYFRIDPPVLPLGPAYSLPDWRSVSVRFSCSLLLPGRHSGLTYLDPEREVSLTPPKVYTLPQ